MSSTPCRGLISTSRAAAALNVSPIDIFVPMIPAIVAGVVAVHVLAYFLERRERKRVGRLAVGSGGARTG